jgi:hypothetical protein
MAMAHARPAWGPFMRERVQTGAQDGGRSRQNGVRPKQGSHWELRTQTTQLTKRCGFSTPKRVCACDLILERLTAHYDGMAPELWECIEA